jgi:hypothetical protein
MKITTGIKNEMKHGLELVFDHIRKKNTDEALDADALNFS